MDIFTQDNTGKIRALQGARFLFFVLIYMSHCATPRVTVPFDFGGESGVAFFFMLSGFVLSWGYGPSVSRGEFDHRRFFWRHLGKLFPLHLLLFAIVYMLDLRIGIHHDWTQTMTSLLLIQSWIPCNHTLYTVNAVSWFLCDTIFFYAIFPWLYRRLIHADVRRIVIWFAVFAAVYCLVALRLPDGMVNCTLYANPLLRSVDFGMGIMVYRIYKTGFVKCHMAALPLAMSVLMLVATCCVYWHLPCGIRCAALFWPVMPVALLQMVASNDSRHDLVARVLGSRPMVWLGGISFEAFMSHPLVMRVVQHFIGLDGTWRGDMVYFAISLVATMFAAYLLHVIFVKPVANVINSHLLRL